jgi:SAM-dependent methyltransferase
LVTENLGPVKFVPMTGKAGATLTRLRNEATALAPLVTAGLARDFLKAVDALPAVRPRTLFHDPVRKAYLTETAARRLDPHSRQALIAMPVDEAFYYHTRYGSPLAYARPIELLGEAGLDSLAGRKVADFGCGGIGPLRLMASLGADVVGIDVDPVLAALYAEPGDQGAVGKGHVALAIGRYPADEAVQAKVGGGLDLFLSKNTLKRGYVHPDMGRASIDLGMDDATFLKALHAALRPGGFVLIYNLGPAPGPRGGPYKPMADIRTPFSRADWEAARFRLVAFDRDDSAAARAMAKALGWDKGPEAMDLERDLFATYTLARRP